MEQFFKLIIIFLVFWIILPTKVFAHPGRTDINGCHICKTNCASWGLKDGEYHRHDKIIGSIKTARAEARRSATIK